LGPALDHGNPQPRCGRRRCIQLDGVVYQTVLDKEAVSSLYLAHRQADPNP
jgi:hypothetical protein